MINLACIDTNRDYRINQLKYTAAEIDADAILHGKELLIACTDLTRNADIVGSPILVPNNTTKYTYSMDLAKVEPSTNQINEMYLYMTLRTDFYHNYIKRWASGTNVLHLNLSGLDWYKIWIPSKIVQDKFASFIHHMHEKKSSILKENQELSALRDFLLPMLMNGQITFKEEA